MLLYYIFKTLWESANINKASPPDWSLHQQD